jgi:hypothetical protein
MSALRPEAAGRWWNGSSWRRLALLLFAFAVMRSLRPLGVIDRVLRRRSTLSCLRTTNPPRSSFVITRVLSTGRVWRCWQHLSDRCRALLDNRQNCELTRGDAEASKLLIEDRSRNLMGAADEKARQKLQFIRDVLGIPSPLNRLPGWRPQCPRGVWRGAQRQLISDA